jgi:hypothetical protein
MTETIYAVGTVTVSNGGTTVTGVGTSWQGKIFEGDLFTDPAQGIFARVTADATSNTSLTINAWPGTALSDDAYEILLMPDSVRASERTRQLLEQLSVVQANGRGLFFHFSDTTTDADPGPGYIRLNNADPTLATAAYIDVLDADGASVSGEIDTWDDSSSLTKGKLWLRSIADPSSFHAYQITGSVVDGTGYRKLTLTYVGGSGSFAADDELMVASARTGDAGAAGDAGVGGITLTFDSSTTDADPGAGEFRLNHATHASATAIYIDNVEALAGASITALLDSWDDGVQTVKGTLTISSKAAPEIFRVYNVTGSVVDGTGYRKLTVAYVTGAGTLSNATSCSLQFTRNGNAGFTPGLRLAFSTTTADADPGAGAVRFNHATFASITQVYVDNVDQGGATITAWLDSLDDVVNANARAYLRFQNVDDPTIYAEFAVTGTVTDGTGYRKIPVSPIVGVIPSNGIILAMAAAKSGADGAGTGDVVGPASSTNNAIARFDGTTGKLLKELGSGVANSDMALMAEATVKGRAVGSGTNVPADLTGAQVAAIVMAGGQLAFPATQIPSANANTLDDYEEGTYTPTYTNITIGNGTVSARYTKIGDMVHLEWSLTWGSTTSATASPTTIGLPFTAAADGSGSGVALDFGSAFHHPIISRATASMIPRSASAGSYSGTVPFTWTTNDVLSITTTYKV